MQEILLRDEKNPEGDLEAPFYADGPDGETLLEAIKNSQSTRLPK